ncbi:MAG: helix-turn-helix domain-containing protein [Eubacteriales bacterium]
MLQNYYREPDVINNNFAAEDTFLQLNCAGEQLYDVCLDISSVRKDNYLVYISAGKMRTKAPEGVGVLEAGDFAVFGKNKPFHYIICEGEPIDYFWVHFGGYGASDILKSCGIQVDTRYRIGLHDTVKRAFEEIFDTFNPKTDRFDLSANTSLLSLISLLAKYASESDKGSQNERLKERLKSSLEYLHAHYTENIDISALAAMDYLSTGRYRELFKSMMNSSPLEYITNLRLNMARELLSGTKLDIASVAEAAGYQDYRYFSRVFKKRFGSTPREYRREEKP